MEGISVIIGVWNGADYLGEAIESALGQTLPPLEVVVVDDGSDDGSGDVARSYGDRVRCVSHERRCGSGAARNSGVAYARGDRFAFLDGDDRFLPDKLELQQAALDSDRELDMVFGWVREFVSPELPAGIRARLGPARLGPWPSPSLMLIRRPRFELVGPFSSTVGVGVTVDWYARAIMLGLQGLMLDAVVLERRLHADDNGIREQASRPQYAQVLKHALERKRPPLAGVDPAGPNPAA
jgi:glycosyltransferase involved in cell wall biosynthesis